jgi:tetratricopeptide (TPR) repeat protein
MKRACCLLLFFSVFTKTFCQTSGIDSLSVLLHTNINDTVRLRIISELIELTPKSDLENYNKELIKIAEAGMKKQKPLTDHWRTYANYATKAYFYKAMLLESQSRPDSGLIFLKKAISIAALMGDEERSSLLQVQAAEQYTTLGNYPEAIDLLYKTLSVFEKQNNYQGSGDAYRALGRIYNIQRNNEKALEFNAKALQSYEKTGVVMNTVQMLYETSVIYAGKKNFPEAAKWMEKAIQKMRAKEKNKDPERFNIFMGLLYYYKQETAEAIPYIQKAIEQAEIDGNTYGLPKYYFLLGRSYAGKKESKKAISALKKSLQLSQDLQDLESESNAAHALYEVYKSSGDHGSALEMHELDVLLTDSIQRIEDEKHLIEQQFKYDYEKKSLLEKAEQEKKINALNFESERNNARKNTWLIVLAAGLLLTGAIAYFLYTSFRQKNIIETQKARLFKQKLLVSQMNPHFIFNSLNAIQNYIFKQNSLQAGTYLSQFSDMIRMILDFSRKDHITLESELSFLKHYMELQQLRLDKKFEYTIKVDENLDPKTVLVPPMLAQPFIENAIEHGIFYKEGKGHVSVCIQKIAAHLEYTIEDDGVGLTAAMNLKAGQQRHKSLATKITEERIETLYTNHSEKKRIELIDRKDIDPSLSGLRVLFAIPYKEAGAN